MSKHVPGPKRLPWIGSAWAMLGDKIALMQRTQARYGDIARLDLGGMPIYVLSRPEYAKHILHDRRDNYLKTARSSQQIEHLSGRSLLVSNGADWQHKRRLLQGAFRMSSVASYAPVMQDACDTMLAQWRERRGVIELSTEMMHLTYRIVGLALLSDDLQATSARIERAMTRTLRHIYRRINGIAVPIGWPTPGNLSFRRERTVVRDIVAAILKRRQEQPGGRDLLATMIEAARAESGSLDNVWLRDEVVTLLLAGHETTANALTWTWYLLAKHPHIEKQAYQHSRAILQDRPASVAQLPQLDYLYRVFSEAMRLYPPIWAIERRALDDDTIDGYSIPAGATVFISVYGLHRHAGYWPEPDRFDPARFEPGCDAQRPDYLYLPFGSGPRMCIGMNFAVQEAMLIMATLMQHCCLRLPKPIEARPQPGITLRSKDKLPMLIDWRD